MLIEYPSSRSPAKAPRMLTGIASVGTSAMRQFCRKSSVTSATSATAVASVTATSRTEARMNSVESY